MNLTPEQMDLLTSLNNFYIEQVKEITGRGVEVAAVVHIDHAVDEPCTGMFVVTTAPDPLMTSLLLVKGLNRMKHMVEDMTTPPTSAVH